MYAGIMRIRPILLVLSILLTIGCQPPQPHNVEEPPANTADSNQARPPVKPPPLPVTMPLIDAMFVDESFADDAKRQAGFTDEELNKIRDAARNAVLEMDGGEAADGARSTRASVESTRKKIEDLIGREKTDRLFEFIRQRWGGDLESLETAKPNSVPNDSRVVVNAPAYRMDVFRDGQLIRTYKVGIGYPEFPLPTGLRRAQEIIFNPAWTPPDEPWVKGKFRPYKKVEPGSKDNPLGLIKIPIGLPSLIHGGKDPARLGNFASHGCVGLTNPMVQDFAMQISAISGTQLTANDVKSHEKTKTESKTVKLAQSVPVEIRYETIVVEDGRVHIYRDVYERGTNTEENLRAVLETFGVSLDSLPEHERAGLLNAIRQMAVDAKGKPVEQQDKDEKPSSTGKVTRDVKGQKEIVVEVAGLRGKGYPAPVNLMER